MLGTTIGTLQTDKFNSFKRDAFGDMFANNTNSEYNMFTGKPNIEGLGYAFLFRNYRVDLGKWQTADPLGYPDGWNNLAYVNNGGTSAIDWSGEFNTNDAGLTMGVTVSRTGAITGSFCSTIKSIVNFIFDIYLKCKKTFKTSTTVMARIIRCFPNYVEFQKHGQQINQDLSNLT